MQDWMQSLAEVVLNHQLTIIEHFFSFFFSFFLLFLFALLSSNNNANLEKIKSLDTCVFPIELICTEYFFLSVAVSCHVHGINTLGMATNYIKLWQVNAHVHCRE